MLCIAGQNLQTLSGTSVTVSFSVANTISQFNVGFFDGASHSAWDMSTASFPTQYRLYADPLGDGTGTTVVATWTDTQMTGNAWADFPVTTSAAAKSPSGNYFYRLTCIATNPAISQLNCFKVRVEGYTYIIPTSIFGFVGAYNDNVTTAATYDGTWDFYMYAPTDMSHLDIWDGDLDVSNDTNDPNTGTAIPSFDTGWAVAEGANPGNPPDDNTGSATYMRSPNIRYDVITPDNTTYSNLNPSGNTEWELFRLDTTTNNTAVTDYQAPRLLSGQYKVHMTGVDLHNLDAFRFEYPLVGVDASGRPTIPPGPFVTTGTVFNDLDRDGIKDAGENGLAGVVLNLKDIVTGSVIAAASTDASGNYTFNTWNGTFDVVIDPSNTNLGGSLYGMSATIPSPATRRITVANGNVTGVNYGYWLPPSPFLTVTPDQSGSIAPSQTIEYTFTVRNSTATAGTFDLTTSSTLGYLDRIMNAGRSTITSVVLASGESTTVIVQVTVPSGATVGSTDVMRLTARRRASPNDSSSATGVTTVADGLSIVANQSGNALPGLTIDYLHTVTNSWPSTRTVTLTAASTNGFTSLFYEVGGATPITTVVLGPYGATHDIVCRVTAPSAATSGMVGVTTVTATAPIVSGNAVDTVTDTTTVAMLETYGTNTYSTPVDTFVRGSTVYARAAGLTNRWSVYFVWRDSTGAIVRTSGNTTVANNGLAFDQYTTVGTDPTGGWTVQVWQTGTPTLQRQTTFQVTANARITRLSATDASTVGSNIAVTSSTANNQSSPILNTTMTYVIWWDTDGSGTFNSGDTYIDSAGAPHVWNGVTAVSTHVTTGVDVPGNGAWTDPPWTIANTQFPNQGNYHVTATWTDSGGVLIDRATNEFFSIPTLGWPLFALMLAGAMAFMWTRARKAGWVS
jgi:SdrD B-like domain